MKTRTMLVVAVTLLSLLLGHSTAHARSEAPGASPQVAEVVAEEVAERLATSRNVTFHGPDGQVATGTMATLGLVGSGVPLAEALDRTLAGDRSGTDARITFPLLRVAVEFNRAETATIALGAASCSAVVGLIPFWPTKLVAAFCAVNSAVAGYYYARGWCSKVQSGFPVVTRLEHAPHKSSYCR